jgi:rhodanese-related sulfurtransferase
LSAVEAMLARVREGLDRVRPEDLDAALAAGALVVDIRPDRDRFAEGDLPGAVVLERNVLEWRLDPTSPDAIPEADVDRQVIIVCNEGFASSLAANTLRELGLTRASDLEGGYRAWYASRRAAGSAVGGSSSNTGVRR